MSRRRRGRFPRSKRMQDAAEAIAAIVDHYKLGRSMKARELLTDWNEIVGERVASRTWPGRVDKGVLSIRVSNSAWMHELSFMRESLLERIREATGGRVKEIRMTVGSPRRQWLRDLAQAEAQRRRPAGPPPRKEIEPATGAELARIHAETDTVADDELREIIREARRRLNL